MRTGEEPSKEDQEFYSPRVPYPIAVLHITKFPRVVAMVHGKLSPPGSSDGFPGRRACVCDWRKVPNNHPFLPFDDDGRPEHGATTAAPSGNDRAHQSVEPWPLIRQAATSSVGPRLAVQF